MAERKSTEVILVRSLDDGQLWAKYIIDLLQRIGTMDVQVVDMDSSAKICPSDVLRHDQTIIVLIASPEFLNSLMNGHSTNFDQLVLPCRQATGSAVDPVILFLCGTTLDDFDEVDKTNQPLINRFPCVRHWHTVDYEHCSMLPRTICNVLSEMKNDMPKQHKKLSKHIPKTGQPKPGPKQFRQKIDFKMVPEEAKCEEPTLIMLSFTEPIPDGDLKMHVEITSETDPEDEKAVTVKAPVYPLNCLTAYFMAPPNMVGNATVRLVRKGFSIGSKTLVYGATMSEASIGIIQILLHQMNQLCRLLLIDRRLPDPEDVDQMLSGIFQDDPLTNEIPAVAFEKMLQPYRFVGNFDDNSLLELPTPLHFAAKYGLNELSSRLMDLPDARSAYIIPNANGNRPEDLARTGGHSMLASVFENFREVGDGFNAIYQAYINSAEKSCEKGTKKTVKKDTTQSLYLDMSGRKNMKVSDDESSSSSYEDIPPEQQCKQSKFNRAHFPVISQSVSALHSPSHGPPVPNTKPASSAQTTVSAVGSCYAMKEAAVAASAVALGSTSLSPGSSQPAGSQQELLNILQQVKLNQLTMAQAEMLFQEWQMHYQDGLSASFKQKQKQLAEMRTEVQRVKESSVCNIFSTFRFGRKKEGNKSSKPEASLPTGIDSKPLKSHLSAVIQPDSPRSSLTSCSSRESTASRSSTASSGVETEMSQQQNLQRVEEEMCGPDAPETPPIPPRKPAAMVLPHEEDYMALVGDDVAGIQYNQLTHQVSMPESGSVRLSILNPRKKSCPDALKLPQAAPRQQRDPPPIPEQKMVLKNSIRQVEDIKL